MLALFGIRRLDKIGELAPKGLQVLYSFGVIFEPVPPGHGSHEPTSFGHQTTHNKYPDHHFVLEWSTL